MDLYKYPNHELERIILISTENTSNTELLTLVNLLFPYKKYPQNKDSHQLEFSLTLKNVKASNHPNLGVSHMSTFFSKYMHDKVLAIVVTILSELDKMLS